VPRDESIVREARAKLDPALADIVGPLMSAPKGAGCLYVVKGLRTGLTFTDVATIMKRDLKWKVRPERFLKAPNNKSNTMVVFAIEPPAQNLIKIDDSEEFLQIEDFITHKPKSNDVDKIFQAFRNAPAPDEWYKQNDSYDDDEVQERSSPEDEEFMMSDVEEPDEFEPSFLKHNAKTAYTTKGEGNAKTLIGSAWQRRVEANATANRHQEEEDKAENFWQAPESEICQSQEIFKNLPANDDKIQKIKEEMKKRHYQWAV
jgi:hypothetical protein